MLFPQDARTDVKWNCELIPKDRIRTKLFEYWTSLLNKLAPQGLGARHYPVREEAGLPA